jgi:hypothetical protein
MILARKAGEQGHFDRIRSRVEGGKRTEENQVPNGLVSGLRPRMAAGRGAATRR